jgi:hypothetical protein
MRTPPATAPAQPARPARAIRFVNELDKVEAEVRALSEKATAASEGANASAERAPAQKERPTKDDIIASLRTEFALTDEEGVGAFLGTDIKRNTKGHIELTQPRIIQKIITKCGLQ